MSPADQTQGGGGGAGQGAGQLPSVPSPHDEEWEAVVEWINNGDTFKADETEYRFGRWSRNHVFQVKVIAASFSTWAEARGLGQIFPGRRDPAACRKKWHKTLPHWTEEEDELFLSCVGDQTGVDDTQLAERKAGLIRLMVGQGRSEAKCQGRLKLFRRHGKPIKGNNMGVGPRA